MFIKVLYKLIYYTFGFITIIEKYYLVFLIDFKYALAVNSSNGAGIYLGQQTALPYLVYRFPIVMFLLQYVFCNQFYEF